MKIKRITTTSNEITIVVDRKEIKIESKDFNTLDTVLKKKTELERQFGKAIPELHIGELRNGCYPICICKGEPYWGFDE